MKFFSKQLSARDADAGTANKLLVFLLVDALVYSGAIFFVQVYNLLHFDGAASGWKYCLVTAACSAMVFLLALAYQKTGGRLNVGAAAAEVALFLLITLVPLVLIEIMPAQKGLSVLWMPGEWLKMPRVILFGARVAFPFFVLFVIMLLAGLHAMLRGRKPVLIYLALVVSWIAAVSCALILLLQVDIRSSVFIIAVLLPMVLILAGALRRAGRLTARSIIFLIISMSIMPYYFGLVPYFSNNPAFGKIVCFATPDCDMKISGNPRSPAPGVERIYPKQGQEPKFPLVFMRQFYQDVPRGLLFSTYGPTCGFIRLNVRTGDLDIMKYEFLVRYLWSEDDLPYMLAPDWNNSDMLVLDKDTFKIIKRFDLYRVGINVPWNMTADEKYIYLLSTEYPLLARFERDTFKYAGKLDFHQLGLIPMRFGAYGLTIDPARHHAFVTLGALDMIYNFRLVRIDTKRFKVEASRVIGTGSTLMTALPSKGTFLTYDFYSNKVTEVDQETLKARRTFDGVFQCRAVDYDEARDLLYMVGYGLGELKAIDYSTGKTIRNYYIGNKAGSLFLSPREDALLVGSALGIYHVDLNKFTGMKRKIAAPKHR